MRIAFLCSSLEPGKDGVGDYSTLLAQECTHQGHPTALVALNDRHIGHAVEGALSGDTANPTNIPYLRLPSADDWTKRTTKAVAFVQSFAPDWVSLQLVCYGFQDKGIIGKQVRYLRTLSDAVRPAQTHLMLHELWIGDNPDDPIKDKIIGSIQRHFVLNLIKAWNPPVSHTSNEYYRQRLEKRGQAATNVLPLFSNIPMEEEMKGDGFYSLMKAANLPVTSQNRTHYLIGGFFGMLPPEWKPEPLVFYLETAAIKMGRKLILLSAGRMGVAGKKIWHNMMLTYGSRFSLYNIGERAPDEVSDYLNHLDFGIAGASLRLIGKSSTTATMLDHGLPVIISQLDDQTIVPWDDRSATLLQIANSDFPGQVVAGLPRLPPFRSLPVIAQRFIHDLSYANRVCAVPKQ